MIITFLLWYLEKITYEVIEKAMLLLILVYFFQ
jgi:hypothetical protein